MTVALSDTQLLCDMLRPLPDFADPLLTARTTAAFYTRRKPLSATINTLANALYRVRGAGLFALISGSHGFAHASCAHVKESVVAVDCQRVKASS